MGKGNNRINKSFKKLVASYILSAMFFLSIIFITRIGINEGFNGFYSVVMNCIFTVLFIGNLSWYYKNYKFIIDNNYKIYSKTSRNLVIALTIVSVLLLLVIDIFGNTLFKIFFLEN